MLTSTVNTYEVTGSSATSYTFNQPIHKSTDLIVYVSSVIVPAVDGSNPHTVTVATNKQSATVIFNSPPGAVPLKFERTVEYKQETDLANNSLFDAESLETTLDNIVMQTLQAGKVQGAAFHFHSGIAEDDYDSTVATASTLNKTKTQRASKALAFDADGDITVSTEDIDAQIAATAASATAAATSATASAASATSSAADLATFQGIFRGSSTSTPGSPTDGDLWFDTNTDINVMKVYNSTATAWEQLTPSSSSQTNINTLSASAVVTDMALLATTDCVADMAILATADVVTDMNVLATADVVTDMNTLGTADVVTDMNTLGTADVVADMNTLGTADVVADLNLLATSAVVTDMDLLATTACIADMALLGTSDAVADMAILATTAIVADMAILGSTTVTDDMALLAVPAVITDMDLLGATGVIGDIETVADSIADVNRYANEYKIAASEPGSPSEGDMWMDTTTSTFKVHNGTSFATVTEGQSAEEVTTEATSKAIAMAIVFSG